MRAAPAAHFSFSRIQTVDHEHEVPQAVRVLRVQPPAGNLPCGSVSREPCRLPVRVTPPSVDVADRSPTDLGVTSNFLPKKFAIGSAATLSTSAFSARQPIALDFKTNPVATIDYGAEVAGYPYFDVSAINGPIQIEIKYTEQWDGLNHVWADGPYCFANGLSNTFRVETFNATEPGRIQSYFVQGGQRWESITVITEGSITFSEVGLVPTIANVDLDNLPSTFQSSNQVYNQVWKLGAGSGVAACFDDNSQPSTWEVTKEGALIRGQRHGTSIYGNSMSDYTMTFTTNIVRGGSGWSVQQPVGRSGLLLLLVSNLPEATSFANTNRTLTPPNSVVVASGWGYVNQTTLTGQAVGSFPVGFDILEGQWYTISTSLTGGTQLSVSIDSKLVLNISLTSYGVSAGSSGGWGFGGWQDQSSLVKDVIVYAGNGTKVYENPMTSPDIVSEYGVRHNTDAMCMDGAKRDRLVWMGDFFHTSKIIPASSSRWDHVRGTLEYLSDTQVPNGQMDIAPQMGYDTNLLVSLISGGAYNGLEDYQVLGLLAFTGYYYRTRDLDWAKSVWPAFKKQADWIVTQISSTTGLITFGGFIGPSNGTAVNAAVCQALNEAALVGDDVGDTATAAAYRNTAADLAKAINALLWNDNLGVYSLSTSDSSDYSITGVAFAITSGVASQERANLSLARIADIKLAPGYMDSSSSNRTSANISPNTNGFLLYASLMANDTSIARYLLDSLWAAMLDDRYASGASWEYVAQNLTPGLSLFTSLSHPWGGAATYVLTELVAGIRPVTAGYQTWLFQPSITGFDLDWASASVVTGFGNLSIDWSIANDIVNAKICAPAGTSGTFNLPPGSIIKSSQVNGKKGCSSGPIDLGAGCSAITVQVA